MSWQLMTRGSAQAGNRAGKTARYLQWQEHRPEWLAVTSAVGRGDSSDFMRFLQDTSIIDQIASYFIIIY